MNRVYENLHMQITAILHPLAVVSFPMIWTTFMKARMIISILPTTEQQVNAIKSAPALIQYFIELVQRHLPSTNMHLVRCIIP